jgi:hypothetical protein
MLRILWRSTVIRCAPECCRVSAWFVDFACVCVEFQPVLSGHELPPFDSDDIALAFLHKCGYNVALARLELTAALGYGHGRKVIVLPIFPSPPFSRTPALCFQ